MQLILVSDIFGRTEHVDRLAETLMASGIQPTVVDPYAGADPGVSCETDAYVAFQQHCGHDAYRDRVRSEMARCEAGCMVLGFSAGASAAWRAVAEGAGERVSQLIGFYPGQIRHHTELRPRCPATLVFPRREDHFDVTAVMAPLPGQGDVVCVRVPWLHGFMNPASQHYSADAASHMSAALSQREVLMSVATLRQHFRHHALAD